MFIQITPINQVTGVATGNPIFVGQDSVIYVQRVSATADHVDYTVVLVPGATLICSETPEHLLPLVYGAGVRA